jgi:hypothetical protein
MTLRMDSGRSRVVIETRAKGMLASLAHDLRVLAPIASGEASSDDRCTATFDVSAMKVDQSCKHNSGAWGAPSPSDRSQIEEKIGAEVFKGVRTITVEAQLTGSRAKITVTAGAGKQSVDTTVSVERADGTVRAKGEATLSLEALKATQPKVPLGAIKLEDAVVVRFDVVLA